MQKKFVARWFYSGIGKYEDEITEGLLWWKKKKTVQVPTPRTADYDNFVESLESIYNKLDEEGYEVVNVLPLNLGTSEPNHAILTNGNKNYLGDVGFSVTRGAVVIGRLKST